MSDICCSVVIGRDLSLLRWCLENARARAGIPHDWLAVNWVPAENPEAVAPIAAWCKVAGVRYASFTAEPRPVEGNTTLWFLRQLYRGWNMGYSESQTKWVARLGSDQFFSKGWLARLMEAAEEKGERGVYHSWTVESPLARHSRHDIQDWGTTWQAFDLIRFERYAAERAWRYRGRLIIPGDECALYYYHPHKGVQQRADGVTWLQTKKLWEDFGPLLDTINEEGVTGDVSFMDTLTDAGVRQYLIPSSTTYHLVRGESREIQAQPQ